VASVAHLAPVHLGLDVHKDTISVGILATVDRLRASVHAIPGADAKVGGGSAVNLDIQRATRHDRNLVVPLVLVVVLDILALVLRAIISPCCWSPPSCCRSRPRWA
jgi:predicted RND superfamily exporter protein